MSLKQGTSKQEILLPVGDKLGWDVSVGEDEESVDLRSVAESCVLARSLKQSRDKWLYQTFPKFMGKARGNKAQDVVPPPPHTIQTRGRCTLEIGPHIFSDTIFYEVHYLPPQPTYPNVAQQQNSSYATSSWQAISPYGSSFSPRPPNSIMSTATPSTANRTPTSQPLTTSLTAVTTITPELISQVNTAASSNPILASLLQLAAAGKAAPDQLKTLGLLIQSLASSTDPTLNPPSISTLTETQPQSSSTSIPEASESYQTMPLLPPVKDFDVVIEFRETPSERWLIPRGPAIFEPTSLNSADWTLTLRLPFEKAVNPAAATPEAVESKSGELDERQAVSISLSSVPLAVSDTLRRWIGGEANQEQYRQVFQSLKPLKRLYLGYHLPPGALLTQLKALAEPHPMKLLKHGPMPVRPPRQRRTQSKVTGQTNGAVKAQEPNPRSRSNAGHAAKRQKTAQPAAYEIQCLVCKQKDVPLILGGRYCRPCVDSGRASVDTSYPPITSASMTQVQVGSIPLPKAPMPLTDPGATSRTAGNS